VQALSVSHCLSKSQDQATRIDSYISAALADNLANGLEKSGVADVCLFRIRGEEIVDGRFENEALMAKLCHMDAIVFGSPTYMGGVAAQFKAFADATSELWSEQQWAGKLASGFTCGSAPNGDQSSALQYLVTLASQHGMLWTGLDLATGYTGNRLNRLGCQLGVVAQSVDGKLEASDLATAEYLGERLAQQLKRLDVESR